MIRHFGSGRLVGAMVSVLGLASRSLAHPGHPYEVVPADSPAHYWGQPEHAIIFLLAGILFATMLVAAAGYRRRLRPAN